MKYDSVLWNDKIKTPQNEYYKRNDYLFDKDEFLSDKLKKYNLITAQKDLLNELTPYHAFVADARCYIKNNITVYKLTNKKWTKAGDTKIITGIKPSQRSKF